MQHDENYNLLSLLRQYSTQSRFYGKFYPKIPFVFAHNKRDFVVEELPLYPFSNSGEHRILKVKKRDLETLQCVKLIAEALQIDVKSVGYAGLKDKNAFTSQYISVPNKAFIERESILHEIPDVRIVETHLHDNKIKIGHLQGNRFFLRLKKVLSHCFERIKEEVFSAQKYGFPNFFGYQRFGNFGDNYMQALDIKKPPNKQTPLQHILISSLQSVCFNLWLEERLKISNIVNSFSPIDAMRAIESAYKLRIDSKVMDMLHHASLPLTPLVGDVCMHYPHGKFFYLGEGRVHQESIDTLSILENDIERLRQHDICITGLLSGMDCYSNLMQSTQKTTRVKLAKEDALHIEQRFCHDIMAHGTRRYAWVYPWDVEIEYYADKACVELGFKLPSGAYATSFLSYIKNGDVRDFD